MPDAISLRERFPRGCRVRFSAEAFALYRGLHEVTSTVVGYSRDGQYLYIVREGNTSKEPWRVAFLTRIEGARQQAPTLLTGTCLKCGTRWLSSRWWSRARRYCSLRCRRQAARLRYYYARKRPNHASAS